MNGEVEVLKIKAVAFPQKFEARDISEDIIVEKANAANEIKNPVSPDKENRFARLKKHLRKRSASIL